MRTEDMNVIDLGTASTATRGGTMGIADGESGKMVRFGLRDD